MDRVDDAGPFVATVVLAFGTDPFVRWLLPDPDMYLDYFTRIVRLHGQLTAAYGGAFGRADRRGAALWYPPETHPDSQALAAILGEAGALERAAGVFGRAAVYEPTEPFWYLRQIGVDPSLQGRGAGGALMAAGLAEADAAGVPAYLEATSERGVQFYERHGFHALAEIRVDDSAPIWPMRRDARPAKG
ncbi:MAG: GNAT family N-acetyltransferase [Actinomycetota bacterium]